VAVLSPVDVEVDRLSMLLVAVLKPVEVEVDRLSTLLFVVLKLVDRLLMPLVAVLNPDESKPSINHALARGVGADARREDYASPSSIFQGSIAS
jgi:hypothetical protein